MGDASLEGCAGFLVSRTGACPLVGGAGPCPSGGQGHVKDVFRGGCGLRKSFGSLSADGWACIPSLLVVWPEASQDWSLQAVG